METASSNISTQTTPKATSKLNLTHRRRRQSYGDDGVDSTTGFCGAIHKTPPTVPATFLRRLGTKDSTGIGKVRVLLRVCGNLPESSSDSSNFFTVDSRMKQVTIYDPSTCNVTSSPESRRVGIAAPKMFAFDTICVGQDSQTEVCNSALADVIHSVINGTDGCVFCFGNARLGKSYTMIGTPESSNTLGVIPCSIYWLFRGIAEHKQKTGTRFSVRVSAVEVAGTQHVKDLLVGLADEGDESPGVYLRDDPLFGTQLQNQTELRVSTPEKAAYYLDTSLSARTNINKNHHFLFTLHIYQYSVTSRGRVSGGRSRLHLLDLGSCDQTKCDGGLPLSGLGNVILAILNGHKHLPYREQKISQLLKECLQSVTCHAAMIAHVSPNPHHYNDTLATVQLASRIHRMRRHKIKFGANLMSEDSCQLIRQENGHSTGSSDVDPSSSEQSADTVIYVGPLDDATDGEHPPVYIPSLSSGDNRCVMGKVLKGSGIEHRHRSGNSSLTTSPAKQSPNVKLINGVSHDKKDSPTHRSGSKISQKPFNSSPNARSPISNSSSQKFSPSKSSTKSSNSKTSALGSDEKWIDGPRISKCKAAEARVLLKDSSKKNEKWIDGPLKVHKPTPQKQINGTCGYGFMDSHKKNMIKKWVENQTLQHVLCKNVKVVTPLPRPPTTGGEEKPCELVKSNCDTGKGEINSENLQAQKVNTNFRTEDNIRLQNDVLNSIGKESICTVSSEKCVAEDLNTEMNTRRENQGDGCEDPKQRHLEESPEHKSETSAEIYSPVSDVKLKAGDNYAIEDYEQIDDFIDIIDGVEIIEVEEPLEPVPTQDAWLQVTEEDIALSMSESETFILEEDESVDENHPLHALSEESFDLKSPFSDMTDEDIKKNSNTIHLGGLFYCNSKYRPNSLQGTPDNGILSDYFVNKEQCVVNDVSSCNQLAKLHEVFKTKLARTNSCKIVDDNSVSPFRCHSFSLSDVFCSPNWSRQNNMKEEYSSGFSIFSEPLSNLKKPPDENLCMNCKSNIFDSEKTWYKELLQDNPNICNKNGYRFKSKLTGSWYNISSLRHPDGSSNPDLKGEVDSILDKQVNFDSNRTEIWQRKIKSLSNMQDEDDELPPKLPPPFIPSTPTRVHNSFFKRCVSKCKTSRLEQHNSLCIRSKSPTAPLCTRIGGALRFFGSCENTDYDPIQKDSDCCSIDSSTEYQLETFIHRQPSKVSVLQYCREDVERLERRWSQTREGRMRELLQEQSLLKDELSAAKRRLCIPDSRWKYDLNVVENMDQKDPTYLEALEKETYTLRRRVDACKSRILMVTCFDIIVTSTK